VTLPVAAEDNPAADSRSPVSPPTSEQQKPSQADLLGVRVLVVDDECDACSLVKRVLENRRADVEVAASAEEGYSKLADRHFDVLVSDIGMPGEDGYQFLRRVRALPQERNGQIAAVALTAFAGEEDQKRAARAGFQQHVAKPVEQNALLAVIAQLAGRG
jgi:CheY-like chemotaxis protein